MKLLNFIIEYIINELIFKELGNNYYCRNRNEKKNDKKCKNIKGKINDY